MQNVWFKFVVLDTMASTFYCLSAWSGMNTVSLFRNPSSDIGDKCRIFTLGGCQRRNIILGTDPDRHPTLPCPPPVPQPRPRGHTHDDSQVSRILALNQIQRELNVSLIFRWSAGSWRDGCERIKSRMYHIYASYVSYVSYLWLICHTLIKYPFIRSNIIWPN